MKKRIVKSIAIVLVCVFMFINFGGCFGGFKMTKKIHNWNAQIENKWKRTLIMWVMIVVPVYQVAVAFDLVILNVLEFWTGINPLVMKAGEKEVQLVHHEGEIYEITVTKNRFDVVKTDGQLKASLVYDEQTKSWYAETKDLRIKVAEMEKGDHPDLKLISPMLALNSVR